MRTHVICTAKISSFSRLAFWLNADKEHHRKKDRFDSGNKMPVTSIQTPQYSVALSLLLPLLGNNQELPPPFLSLTLFPSCNQQSFRTTFNDLIFCMQEKFNAGKGDFSLSGGICPNEFLKEILLNVEHESSGTKLFMPASLHLSGKQQGEKGCIPLQAIYDGQFLAKTTEVSKE